MARQLPIDSTTKRTKGTQRIYAEPQTAVCGTSSEQIALPADGKAGCERQFAATRGPVASLVVDFPAHRHSTITSSAHGTDTAR
jgi:hypothetical protein